MTQLPFRPRLRAAAIIQRWSIVHTAKRDCLAAHSYFVTLYSGMVVDLIGWPGPRALVLDHALTHDLEELITGDLVSPVKHEILDSDKAQSFIERKMRSELPAIFQMRTTLDESVWFDEAHRIVKAADALDAVFYALGEQVMGNQIIGARVPSGLARLEVAWYHLPASAEVISSSWDVVNEALDEHRDPNCYDLERKEQ